MEFEFISNTGAFLSHKGTVIGMDLWFTQGAFEGSWYHFPPLRPTKYSVADCDVIYISHIHPDHCDFNFLRSARRETLFVVPAYFDHLLKRKLAVFGFHNVLSLAPGEEADLPGGARVRLYGQFVNSLGASADFGSLIDSALLIRWDGQVILNCNDNYLDVPSARAIHEEFGDIRLAMIPHSASGPYPASFRNLTLDQKHAEANRLRDSYVDQFVEVTDILRPQFVVPCAAEYVVVGRMHKMNDHIGLAPPDLAADRWNKKAAAESLRTRAIHLDCGTLLDLETGAVGGLPARRPTLDDRMAYARNFKDVGFRYEWEDTCTDIGEIDRLMERGRDNIWRMQSRLKWFKDYNVYLNIDGLCLYHFNFAQNEVNKLDGTDPARAEPYLEAFLSPQLLYSILTRRVHWNNAEGGLHIDFFRHPNTYVPETFTLLSFLHERNNQPETAGTLAIRR